MSDYEKIHAALAAIEGLTFAACADFFHRRASERDKQIAGMVRLSEDAFENDHAIVSEGDENGAYVLGWRWVPFDGTPLDKNTYEDEG